MKGEVVGLDLRELMEIQKAGVLAVKKVEGSDEPPTVGGESVSREELVKLVKALGWIEWSKKEEEIIDKTDKFIRAINRYLTNDAVIEDTEITFQNKRVQDSLKYFDRIKLINPDFNLTILYGMPGVGGTYALYDVDVSTKNPEITCRSVKALCEYLNETFE